MARYYYSTQPFLAWCLNHYFYGQTHFAYVGAPFYPYRLPNPRSSNPLRIYEDLYEPWKERDDFSSILAQKRLKLRLGVNVNTWSLGATVGGRLLNICDNIDLVFFYPLVYRIDIDNIDSARLLTDSSGLFASNEYKITALGEDEFEILFADFETESISAISQRGSRAILDDLLDLWNETLSSDDALSLLEEWLI